MSDELIDASRHDLSRAWGDMPPDEFDLLVQDIKRNGIRHGITWFGGRVLDGHHRHRAGLRAKAELEQEHGEFPKDEKVVKVLESIQTGLDGWVFNPETDGDPVNFVISANATRRHLSKGQAAAIIVQIRSQAQSGRPEGTTTQPQSAPQPVTRSQIAEESGASLGTVDNVRKAAEDPELLSKVATGEMSAHAAAKQVRESEAADAPKSDPVEAKPESAEQPTVEAATEEATQDEKIDQAIQQVESDAEQMEAPPRQSLKEKTQELEALLIAKEDRIESLQKRIGELETTINADPEMADYQSRIDSLTRNLQVAKVTGNQFQAQYADAAYREEAAKKRITMKDEALASSRAEIEAMGKVIAELRKENEALRDQVATLQKKLDVVSVLQ